MSKTDDKTINQKIEQLNAEVEWFYGDDFSLDQATEKYQASIELAKEIESDLENLKNKITVLSEDFTKA
ncbi:exodeoxyribonuclease VII small subunit [Candidatus Saccharibacteria bacterium]|nr:exodeoxyribonuclease VII small subunit [Candidatus Saccharibacteria bacterium]